MLKHARDDNNNELALEEPVRKAARTSSDVPLLPCDSDPDPDLPLSKRPVLLGKQARRPRIFMFENPTYAFEANLRIYISFDSEEDDDSDAEIDLKEGEEIIRYV